MGFDYYYNNEAEQFTFFRIPKILMTSPQFKGISDGAKILYGLMLDRMSLSMRNRWFDEQGRAYIKFTVSAICEEMGCSKGKACKMIDELDVKTGVGLIEHIKQGQGNAAVIYVKKFIDADNSRKTPEPVQKSESKDSKNCTSCGSKIELQEVQKLERNNTNKNNTDLNNINPSFPKVSVTGDSIPCGRKERKDYQTTVSEIKKQIEYDALISVEDKGTVDNVVSIMANVMTSDVLSYKINRAEIPAEKVREQFKRINYTNLSAFLLMLSCEPRKIHDYRAFLLTALYNVPDTAEAALANKVRCDMYGDTGGCGT